MTQPTEPNASDTPLTDAEEVQQKQWFNDHKDDDSAWPADFDFARDLERALASATRAKEQAERERDAHAHDCSDLRLRNAQLQEAMQTSHRISDETLARAGADLAAARDQVEALRKDEGRLTWMESQDVLTLDWISPDGTAINLMSDPCERIQCEPNLRSAIDAAMERTGA